MHKKSKVISKKSNISTLDKSLFANAPIKRDSIIVEFKGKVRSSASDCNSSRKAIFFNDGHALECYPNDLATTVNDAIDFPKDCRFLTKTLRLTEPFYKKYNTKCKINAEIKINNKLHRAFLTATDDIAVGEEIFIHNGFMYWFKTEFSKIGFLEEESDLNRSADNIFGCTGLPDNIFDYPAFRSYIKEFYPKAKKCAVISDCISNSDKISDGENYELVIYFEKGQNTITFEKFDTWFKN